MARASPPKAAANQSGQAKSGQGSIIWVQGLLCGAVVVLATPTAVLMGVLFFPALAAMLLDRQFDRPIARSVALFSLCAVVTPLRALWASGQSMDAAMALALDTQTLAIAWGAASVGWLLAELMPVAARVILETMAVSRAASLRVTRARYAADWGFPEAPE